MVGIAEVTPGQLFEKITELDEHRLVKPVDPADLLDIFLLGIRAGQENSRVISPHPSQNEDQNQYPEDNEKGLDCPDDNVPFHFSSR